MKPFRITTFLLLLISFSHAVGQVSKVWETQTLFMAPESVVFDPVRNSLYVGNFNDQGGFLRNNDSIRNECISRLSPDGSLLELRWIDSLHNPTGICIFNDRLYIAEREGIAIADIENQKIVKRIKVKDAVFLNDIVVDQDGTVYISDTFKPCIHRIKDGKSEVWYDDSLLNSSNGLIIDNNHLLVGNRGEENLLSISLADKSTTIIGHGLSENIDGIRKCSKGYLLSWNFELYLLEQGNKRLLYELDNKDDFLADFEFIAERKLLIIPLLMTNKVIALRLSE